VGVSSLTRQFRRYFDRFEGRIREPPYAVYDDLAYTQGSPPEKQSSPDLERNTEVPPSSGGMIAGPNLEEYRERLRGFAMDLGRDEAETAMQGVLGSEESTDLGQLYNFPILQQQSPSAALKSYAEAIDSGVFSTLESFPAMSEQHTTGANVLSPTFDLGGIPSIGSHHSTNSVPGGQLPETLPDFLFEDGGGVFDNFDDLFGDMPDMPGLDGAIDQGFLEFLDTTQH